MGGVRELRPAARRIAPKCAPNCAACLNLLLLMLLGGELRLHLRLHLRLELRAHEGVDLRLHLGLLQQRRVRVAARRRAAPARRRRPDPRLGQQRLPPTPGSCEAAAAPAPPIAPAPGGRTPAEARGMCIGGDGEAPLARDVAHAAAHRRRGGRAVREGDVHRRGRRRQPEAGEVGAAPRLRREGSAADGGGAPANGSPSGTPPSAIGGVFWPPGPAATDPAARAPGRRTQPAEPRLRLPSGSSSPAPTAAEFSAPPLPFAAYHCQAKTTRGPAEHAGPAFVRWRRGRFAHACPAAS